MSKDVKVVSSSIKLREELKKKNEEYYKKDDIFGMTLLTNPGYISSSRNIMFTSHLRQFVNIEDAEFPRVFYNFENIVGKYSSGYYQCKSDLEIVDIIPRFEDGVHDKHLYTMIVYDKKKDMYGMIQKVNHENLTEKYGFSYDSEVIDSKSVGDTIEEGEVLFKTHSYDEHMNYRYGKNAKFAYALDLDTIEDGVAISESFSKKMVSKTVENITVSLNDNDILRNIYGDSENYKAFPDIGEEIVDKIICAKLRIHNSQLLYDIKKSNLRKINPASDTLTVSDGIIDNIEIFCNKNIDELPDTSFNRQIRKYLIMQERYYTRLRETLKVCIESGSNYSDDIAFYYKKAKDALDPDYKWMDTNNSIFSNIIIEFTVYKNVYLSEGQKITGRYGNKGVITAIRPDDEMPVTETGDRIEIIFNTLGIINRLNTAQLYEQSITFIMDRVCQKMKTLQVLEEKEELLLKAIGFFNEREKEELREHIKELSLVRKTEFFESVERDGIFIHIPPLWEDEPIFDKLVRIYDEFDWIKPYKCYINKFGRKIEIMKPLIIGSMYVIKLKQTPDKNMSARSTGRLSKKGVPEKSNKSIIHQELYSKTPVRIGDQENINLAIGIPSDFLSEFHLFYRSSPLARADLAKLTMTNHKPLEKFEINDDYRNRNVEVLQAYLKCLGLKIVFDDETYKLNFDTGKVKGFNMDEGGLFIGTQSEYDYKKERRLVEEKYRTDQFLLGTPEEIEEILDKETRENLDKLYKN